MDITQALESMRLYRSQGKDLDTMISDYETLASSGKTPLGLNQWIKSDKPRMEDFNEDNRIIDEKLRELAAGKAVAKSGTWTATFGGTENNGSMVCDRREGRYCLSGDICYVDFYVRAMDITSLPTGNLTILGLPFAAYTNSYHRLVFVSSIMGFVTPAPGLPGIPSLSNQINLGVPATAGAPTLRINGTAVYRIG